MREKQHQKVCTIKILVVLMLVRCACMAIMALYLSGGVRDLRRYLSLLRDLGRVMNKYFLNISNIFSLPGQKSAIGQGADPPHTHDLD